jgi:hypothetical protein
VSEVAFPASTPLPRSLQLEKEEQGEEGDAARADWKSGRRYNNCRDSLLKLKERDMEFKYWRPFVLFLCKLDKAEGTYVAQVQPFPKPLTLTPSTAAHRGPARVQR